MNLLIVEDNHVVTKIWSGYLKKHGWEPLIAHHVPEALELLKDQSMSAIFIDLRLNGITPNGLEIYDYIRHTMQSRVPIAFITGLDAHSELHQRAKTVSDVDSASGIFTRLLKKPVRIAVIQSTLDEIARLESGESGESVEPEEQAVG